MKALSTDSRTVVIMGTAIFIVANLLTLYHAAASDGWSTIGFPLTFYRYTEGKPVSSSSSFEFQVINLFVNYLLALCVSILLVESFKKIRKQKPA